MSKPTFPELMLALLKAWSKETTADPDGWTSENPAWGQCAVTALVVQDFFDGEILRSSLENVAGFKFMRSHYWNLLADDEHDFSQSQFPADVYKTIPQGETRTRDYLLSNPDTKRRYETLKKRVEKIIEKNLGHKDISKKR